MSNGASPSGDRAVVPSASIPSASQLERLWNKTEGKAWEPDCGLRHRFVEALIAGGWVKVCTMRCGFEAFDTGLTWTDAARAYFAASAIETRSAETAGPKDDAQGVQP